MKHLLFLIMAIILMAASCSESDDDKTLNPIPSYCIGLEQPQEYKSELYCTLDTKDEGAIFTAEVLFWYTAPEGFSPGIVDTFKAHPLFVSGTSTASLVYHFYKDTFNYGHANFSYYNLQTVAVPPGDTIFRVYIDGVAWPNGADVEFSTRGSWPLPKPIIYDCPGDSLDNKKVVAGLGLNDVFIGIDGQYKKLYIEVPDDDPIYITDADGFLFSAGRANEIIIPLKPGNYSYVCKHGSGVFGVVKNMP